MVQNCQGMKSIGTRSLNSWSGRDQVWNIKSSSPFIRTQRLEHDFKQNHKCDSIQFHHFLPWRRESESLSFQAQPTEPRFVSRLPVIHANSTERSVRFLFQIKLHQAKLLSLSVHPSFAPTINNRTQLKHADSRSRFVPIATKANLPPFVPSANKWPQVYFTFVLSTSLHTEPWVLNT